MTGEQIDLEEFAVKPIKKLNRSLKKILQYRESPIRKRQRPNLAKRNEKMADKFLRLRGEGVSSHKTWLRISDSWDAKDKPISCERVRDIVDLVKTNRTYRPMTTFRLFAVIGVISTGILWLESFGLMVRCRSPEPIR